jgi:hypothetical protein
MKMWPVCTMLVAAALLLGTVRPGFAGRSTSGAHGEHGAVQSRGAWGPGSHGNGVVPPRSTGHSAVRGPEAGAHRPFAPDHFRGHPEGRARIFIGPEFWWGEPWWWGPACPYSYAAPPVVVPEAPPVYIQPEPSPQQPYYWYYCPNPAGYYPYIQVCPPGWMTVVPPANAPPGAPMR